MRLLARFNDGKEFKKAYMGIVETYETEKEVMENRIKLRKYLRELSANQIRILNASKDESLLKDIIEM